MIGLTGGLGLAARSRASAAAAPVLVGQMSVGVTSVTNPLVVSGSIAVEVGDAITVVFAEQAASVLAAAVTDNLGNTYTACNAGGTNGTTSARMFRSIATSAGTLTAISIACTASTNDAAADVAVFKGPFSAVDAEPVIRNDATAPLTGTATGTLAQASELVVGMLAATSASVTIGATTPWTLAGTPAAVGLRRAATCYLDVAATTSVTPSFTSDAADGTAAAVVQTVSFRRAA